SHPCQSFLGRRLPLASSLLMSFAMEVCRHLVPSHLRLSLTSSTQPAPIMGALCVACWSTPMPSTPRTSLTISEQHGCPLAVAVCAARRDFPLHFVGEPIAEYQIGHALASERVNHA